MHFRASSVASLVLAAGLSLAAAGLSGPAFAAGPARSSSASSVKTVSVPPVKSVPLDTITDWDTFIREFRKAVARRDRTALRQMMAKSFLFGFEDDFNGDARDAAFHKWDNPRVKGWQALDRILARGTLADPEIPGLICSPPQWITDNKHYMDYRAGFDRRDGYWKWVWFLNGE
jgi:hypothetical protein